MNYGKWARLTARQKALWPAADKCYLRRQHRVQISIDADLAAWLVDNVVGRSSFTGDLEETVVTALRVIKGELPAACLPKVAVQTDAPRSPLS